MCWRWSGTSSRATTQGFFARDAEDVHWTVEGTHPLAGRYRTKPEFISHTFDALAKVLQKGAQLHVTHLLLAGDWAIVELESRAVAKDGYRFANKYCWLTRSEEGLIVEVRAYLDSAMVQALFDQHAA